MNFEKAVKFWEGGGLHHAEWADRALDDDERDSEETIKISAAGKTKEEARSRLIDAYNEWINERA